MNEKIKFKTMDQYLATTQPPAREILEQVRQLIKTRVPEATETISYQMPAFRRGKIFIYFAAFKTHIGIYPPVKGDTNLLAALAPYRGPKGNLKFPLNEPMPYDLIEQVVDQLLLEYAN